MTLDHFYVIIVVHPSGADLRARNFASATVSRDLLGEALFSSKSRTFKSACALLLAGATLATIAPTASAAEQPAQRPAKVVATDSRGGAFLDLASQGYTYEEAVEAFKDSDVVTVVRGEIPAEDQAEGPKRVARGVTLGWYVYVKLSKSQATAINYGSAATAAGIIGAITGGIGGAVAAGVYTYIATLGAEGIAKCKKGVEMKFSYTGRARGVKCY
ncbi:hypothetical protein ACISU4_11500 [Streptomyces wuyuanensis]|uniref:hypothetical protein n=1 Tax=Streptomyces wuyuanensis TaxID=1196353 RepID=UPI003806613B